MFLIRKKIYSTELYVKNCQRFRCKINFNPFLYVHNNSERILFPCIVYRMMLITEIKFLGNVRGKIYQLGHFHLKTYECRRKTLIEIVIRSSSDKFFGQIFASRCRFSDIYISIILRNISISLYTTGNVVCLNALNSSL